MAGETPAAGREDTREETMSHDEMAGRVTEEMVARIQAGEHDVWNDLYKHYRDALLLTVRCRLGPRLRARLDSEDILQSVFGDALRELDRFEWRGEGSLRHFLGTLVTHKVRNHVRKLETKKRKGEVPLTGGIEAVFAWIKNDIWSSGNWCGSPLCHLFPLHVVCRIASLSLFDAVYAVKQSKASSSQICFLVQAAFLSAN